MNLARLVERHRVIVTAGSGGVGKTTVAASVALWGALVGRRTVVITIDPARRLASSMGLGTLGEGEREVPPADLHRRVQRLHPRRVEGVVLRPQPLQPRRELRLRVVVRRVRADDAGDEG